MRIQIIMIIAIAVAGLHAGERLAGGFSSRPIEDCVKVYKKLENKLIALEKFTIEKCEVQIVNGINYRLLFSSNLDNSEKCKMVIHKSINGQIIEPIRNREGSSDCFKLYDPISEESL